MGTGYTRNDTSNNIADGNVINASDLDGEFDAIQSAFNGSSGHTHDGTTGEGPKIDTGGLANDAVTAAILDETATFTMAGLSVTGNTTLGDAASDTVTITADIASDLIPSADGTHDLGATGAEWQDLFIDGTANIDSLVADTADINGGSIDGVTIGTNSVVTDLRVDNIKIDANTITSTDTNGDINLTPNGTGNVQLNADTVRVGDSNADATITTFGTGDLTLNTNAGTDSGSIVIADAANGNITITPNGTGDVVIDGLNYPQADGSAGQFMKTDGSGQLSFATVDLTAIEIVNDTSPQLGGNLDTNSHNILIDTAHFIGDENGNEQIVFATTSSAVNNLTVTNAATGNAPAIVATGNDTNIDLSLSGKGSGVTAIGGAATVAGTMYATGNIGLDSTDYIAWTNNTQMDFYVNGANDMRLESDGDLHVEGDVVAFSTTIASDPRLKENVEQVTDAVAKVEQLTGYTFDYKHGGASAGVMSTDVAQVLPSAVTQTTLPLKTGDEETEYDVVAYDQLHALLIEAVKELSARVKELENGSNG
tara:strand:+ start:1204 stop:2820 length:1617 start_codon:yes stop_codon:yes gene_type:complete